MRLQRAITKTNQWFKDNWPFVVIGALFVLFVINVGFNTWASYQCIQAGFLGGQLYNYHVVCYVLWY
jgi:hypothetical protein